MPGERRRGSSVFSERRPGAERTTSLFLGSLPRPDVSSLEEGVQLETHPPPLYVSPWCLEFCHWRSLTSGGTFPLDPHSSPPPPPRQERVTQVFENVAFILRDLFQLSRSEAVRGRDNLRGQLLSFLMSQYVIDIALEKNSVVVQHIVNASELLWFWLQTGPSRVEVILNLKTLEENQAARYLVL